MIFHFGRETRFLGLGDNEIFMFWQKNTIFFFVLAGKRYFLVIARELKF